MNELAISGGRPHKSKPFPQWPMHDERELELVQEVVTSGQWWRMSGSRVDAFESQFAAFQGARYCLGVTNGTQAIELALYALGIGAGDQVIVPAFTFISTGSAVAWCNATPVLVDVDPRTFCMKPEAFEEAITPRTQAVIPVHMAGHSCDMDAICEIARRAGIKVIEDAAHAHGAEWKNRRLGTFGDISIFSFQNGKLMTCGEGGAILTNDEDLYETVYLAHGVGRPKQDRVYAHVILGSNCRMNEFQAAVLIAQLERLDGLNRRREENARVLDELFAGIPGTRPQGRSADVTLHSHYMYMFRYDANHFGGLPRQDFVDCLIAEGIPAFIAYPVLSDTVCFRENRFGGRISDYCSENESDLSNARSIAADTVWLPHLTLLGDRQDLEEIGGAVQKIQHASSGFSRA